MLDIAGVTKTYGPHVALDDVTVTAPAGRVTALLGRNGAGKSTLVSIVSGLLRADRGSVALDGATLSQDPRGFKTKLGVAAQDVAVYPPLSVADNLTVAGRFLGLSEAGLRPAVAAAAERLDITALLPRKARTLSGGEQRRLHVAMALIHQPRVLVLDEPTAGVDVASRHAMLGAVRELAAAGAAVLYTTHYLAELDALDPHVVILDRGRVLAQGRVADLVQGATAPSLKLTFAGGAPSHVEGFETIADGDVLQVVHPEPAAVAQAVLAALGAGDVSRLRGISTCVPTLEETFLALTSQDQDQEEHHAS